MRTVQEIREALQHADRPSYEALAHALAADQRKGVKQALEVARRRLEVEEAERARVCEMYRFQREMASGGLLVGLDEVGRGPMAGPLTVGAVVLAEEPIIGGLRDSKQLSHEQRMVLAQQIREQALAFATVSIPAETIDQIGMTASLRQAFSQALAKIEEQGIHPDVALLDGNPLGFDQREVNVVKGDAKCASIAAASIIAKVDRDGQMLAYAKDYPGYGFESNKGYGSAEHLSAIASLGLSPIHRKSFCTAYVQERLF